jgi:hypothetical protein
VTSHKKKNITLCDTFRDISIRTSKDLKYSNDIGLTLYEESITDYLLLDLVRNHPKQVKVFKFSKWVEGQKSGADWEWWLGGKSGWFPMRVQAKRLDSFRKQFTGLKKTIRSSGIRQVDLLIQDANRYNITPVYLFYGYWDHCPYFHWHQPKARRSWRGCSIADASIVREHINRNQIDMVAMGQISAPLSCLVCCPNAKKSATLQSKAQTLAMSLRYIHNIEDESIPEIRTKLPEYITGLISARTSGEINNYLSDQSERLAGVVLIQDVEEDEL